MLLYKVIVASSIAEDWQWCSLWSRRHGDGEQWLSRWPIDPPRDWLSIVNKPESEAELLALRRCIARGQPFGSDAWIHKTAKALGLESSLRAPHRPRKTSAGNKETTEKG